MKNKTILILLLLGSFFQNTIFAGEGAAAQKEQVPSLQELCFKNILNTLQKEDSDPIKINICESMSTKKVPARLINKLNQNIPHKAAALLWVEHHSSCMSPLSLLQEHRPDLAHLVTQKRISWTLSIQDLIDAGGRQRLQNYANILSKKKSSLLTLSLISLKGLQNIDLSASIELHLDSNKIITIEPDAFNGLSTLRKLSLSGNKITKIKPGSFDGLTALQELYLNNNQITIIGKDTFNGLTKLWSLYLNNNKITKIEPGTFNGLAKLWRLYLNNNQITTIENGAFNGLTTLKELNLDNNPIKTIEPGAFDGLPEELRNHLRRKFNVK